MHTFIDIQTGKHAQYAQTAQLLMHKHKAEIWHCGIGTHSQEQTFRCIVCPWPHTYTYTHTHTQTLLMAVWNGQTFEGYIRPKCLFVLFICFCIFFTKYFAKKSLVPKARRLPHV